MDRIAAFVGHSFLEKDNDVIRKFLEFFDRVKDMGIGFIWDHAQPAEPKVLSQKVLEKIVNKNAFIGICTPREKVIEADKLTTNFLSKRYLKAKKDDFSSKVSDWILQEIGFAFAKQMKIILLLEEGLHKPDGFQGDLEYIPFKRNEPEKSFIKILEMLKTMIPKKINTESIQYIETTEQPKEEEIAYPDDDYLKPKKDWNPVDYDLALMIAIRSNNEERENEVSNKYLQSEHGRGEYEQTDWEAKSLYFQHVIVKKNTLQKLKELSEKYPNHSGVNYYLGAVYSRYDEFEKASLYFQRSAEHAVNNHARVSRLCDSAIVIANQGNKWNSISIIEKAKLIETNSESTKEILLKALSKLSKTFSDDDNYIAFNECLIDQKPDDHDLRFSLAYKYSEMEDYELSLYHYSILRREFPTDASANNFGVAAKNLGFAVKSIEAYKESEKLGGTLAMSNLAHELIKAGFLDEAEEICNRAIKVDGYDKQVGSAISHVRNIKEEENRKEEEKLENAKKRRQAYTRFAAACLKKTPVTLNGIWKGPNCNFNLSVNGLRFEATGGYEYEAGPLLLALLGTSTLSPKSDKQMVVMNYRGEIIGHGVRFEKQTIYKGSTAPLPDEVSAKGFMIILDDLSKIEVYERTKEVPKYSYTLDRIN